MRKARKFWVVYPFSAGALGVGDDYFLQVNRTNALFSAMRRIQEKHAWEVAALFMTDRRSPYEVDSSGMRYRYFPVSLARSGTQPRFATQWSFRLLAAILRERPDAVLLFIGGGWFAILMAAFCRALSIPYYPVIAGWSFSTRRSQRWYYANARRTIVHTEAHRNLFRQNRIDTSNFVVMPMGVDTDVFRAKPLEAYRKGTGPVRLLHVGRIVPGKNLLGALNVFLAIRTAFPGSCFDIVGPVSADDYYRRVRDYIDSVNLTSDVSFHGVVGNDALPNMYATADLTLFPTLSESFGFVIAESMACGTPVAALTGRGSPDEIIENGKDGILTDEEHLAESAVSLLERPDDLRQMGLAARRKIEERYSAARTYHQLLDLLE